jgi:hypothetical protein
MPGTHKRGDVANDFPYPKDKPKEPTHNLNYCSFLFGKTASVEHIPKEKCEKCAYVGCAGKRFRGK